MDQLNSPSKHSYVGSFFQPPDKLSHPVFVKDGPLPRVPHQDQNSPGTSSRVMAALRTLQEKMRRLQLERLQTESCARRPAVATQECPTQTTILDVRQHHKTDHAQMPELASQLNFAETRCVLLEKQLGYMKKMLTSAEEHGMAELPLSDRATHTLTGTVRLENSSPGHLQQQLHKLEKLERECVKLTHTQSLAERKIQLLEQKLNEEKKERELIQEKAEEMQRELKASSLFLQSTASSSRPVSKKKSKAAAKKPCAVKSEAGPPVTKRPPFIAGTSTSTSHSVGANMQSVHYLLQQQKSQASGRGRGVKCQRKSGARQGKGTQSAPRRGVKAPGPQQGASSVDSLSQLLQALESELELMSREHQELVSQISEENSVCVKEALEIDLDALVKKMEEKAAQVTHLRRRQGSARSLQQTACSSKNPEQQQRRFSPRSKVSSGARSRVQPLSPCRTTHPCRQEMHTLRSSLRRDDISWET
ncbi:centrosomal protein CEP57L1 isoform X2 [Denticeps clupeoides]|uniref:centrosomal protein CEP57L1 isoform X2 n=1 Tax=Denticeps clupeoides TaxID=299321 RepID=UPI0010A3F779|nr:centrosomal protein CEP57L1 isoform X2 [Denticeps clupeoides]